MKNNIGIHTGLRYVLVYAWLGKPFPPDHNSSCDIELLRVANLALQRQAKGIADACLFVVPAGKSDEAKNVLVRYGFHDTTVVEMEPCDYGEPVYMDDVNVEIAHLVETWLDQRHPAALTFLGDDYDSDMFWWLGIEHGLADFEWDIDINVVANAFPSTHAKKCKTWLSILEFTLQLNNTTEPLDLAREQAVVAVATLCEWLHGFEAASGNSGNDFDAAWTSKNLRISDFYLGFEASRILGWDIEDIYYSDECESIDLLPSYALAHITKERREFLVASLSEFFGSDALLLWTLHNAIWPRYDAKNIDAMGELLNLETRDYWDLNDQWTFVTERWCESADN